MLRFSPHDLVKFESRRSTHMVMSRSFSAMEETCTYSGGTNDNGTRRGRGIVWKWRDGRTVKEDPLRRGTRSTWMSCTTETFDGGTSATSLCVRGEGSHGSRVVGFEGRSRGAMDGEMGEADSLESDQVRRGRSSDGLVGGSENQSADVWEGEVRTLMVPDLLSCEIENTLTPMG